MNIDEVVSAVSNVTNIEDFRRVESALKTSLNRISIISSCKFNVGQRVSFDTNKGVKYGEIVKINRKSIKVNVGSGCWSISPSLLKCA